MLRPSAPRDVFNVALNLQLIEPFWRGEGFIERNALALDRRKVPRGEAFHERELQLPLLSRSRVYRVDRLGKPRFVQEHGPTLGHVEFEKLNFEREAAQGRGI